MSFGHGSRISANTGRLPPESVRRRLIMIASHKKAQNPQSYSTINYGTYSDLAPTPSMR